MTDLKQVAGGGLLDRRAFLRSGIGLSLAGFADTSAAQALPVVAPAYDIPAWMRMPGGADLAYGLPAAQEQALQRQQHAGPPEDSGFAVWRTPLASQPGVITPSGLHFAVHHNGIPDIDPQQHRLMIHGLVERPLSFDLEQLARYPLVSQIRFIECSGNTAANAASPWARDESCQQLFGEISGSEWAGVPLKLLLREAGIKPAAKWVIAEGADGGSHSRSVPLEKLLDDAIVALYQNGERLRPSQGYPMRLLLPGWEGNVNVKWLHRLEVCDAPAYTKDESGLYSEVLANGEIERFSFFMDVKSVITHPSGQQILPEALGYYEIAGLAWSGLGRITRVAVSADGGLSWADAHLHGPVLDKALTRFSIPWQWDGRSSVLLSRATDEFGRVQPTRAHWKRRYADHSFNHYHAQQAWRVVRNGRVENVYV